MRVTRLVYLTVVITSVMMACVSAQAEWMGNNIVPAYSQWSLSHDSNVSSWNDFWPSRFSSQSKLGVPGGSIFPNGNHVYGSEAASVIVPVIPGKRYQYTATGIDNTWWYQIHSASNYSGWSIEATGYGSSNINRSDVIGNTYTTSQITFIPTSSTVQLKVQYSLDTHYDVSTPNATFNGISLNQVVYQPSFGIGGAIRVNSDVPAGSAAAVSPFLDSMFADDPTSWNINWGDGNITDSPALRSTSSHAFSITSGLSQTWTVTLSGSNQAGSSQATTTITVLRQPSIELSIDGAVVQSESTIQIEPGKPLDLSLQSSLGYIENASFFIDGRLNVSGASLTCSDLTFDKNDIGRKFKLKATVSNSGDGINSDDLMLDLEVIPEPSTMSLLTLSGLAMLKRRRK